MTNDKMIVDNLPTKMRSYPKGTQIGVRGLYYHEAKSVSRYLTEEDLGQLAHLYSEVISGIDVMELELLDFSTLVILSSIWTVGKFEWNPIIECGHILDSTGKQCDGDRLTSPVTLEDFDFSLAEGFDVPRVELSMEGWYYYPRRVIEELQMVKGDDFTNYATCINNENRDAPLEERIEVIKFARVDGIHELNKIHSEMRVTTNPITKECASCHGKVRLRLTLDDVRRCP